MSCIAVSSQGISSGLLWEALTPGRIIFCHQLWLWDDLRWSSTATSVCMGVALCSGTRAKGIHPDRDKIGVLFSRGQEDLHYLGAVWRMKFSVLVPSLPLSGPAEVVLGGFGADFNITMKSLKLVSTRATTIPGRVWQEHWVSIHLEIKAKPLGSDFRNRGRGSASDMRNHVAPNQTVCDGSNKEVLKEAHCLGVGG